MLSINIAVHTQLNFCLQVKRNIREVEKDVEIDRESDRIKYLYVILRCLDSKQKAPSSTVS